MAARPAKRQSKEVIRVQQKAWIEEVIRITRKPASQIAVDAGLSDTTLTRFLREDGGALSPLTITEISRSTGIAAPSASDGRQVSGFREDAEPYIVQDGDSSHLQQLLQLLHNRPDASPWRLGTDVLAMEGLRQGDILIVDMSIQPRDGDIVCAQIYEGMSARTVFRVYQQPYIVGAPMGAPNVRPELVDGQHVVIRGVMTEMLRRRG